VNAVDVTQSIKQPISLVFNYSLLFSFFRAKVYLCKYSQLFALLLCYF